jgi:hypothetical protein
MAKINIEKLTEQSIIRVSSNFSGDLKGKILRDIERGEKPADLIRQMAKMFYEQKEQRAKHSY